MRAADIQTSFSSGMLSEGAWGRIDLKHHSQGAAEITNAIVDSEGGVFRAPGTILDDRFEQSSIMGDADHIVTKMALWDDGDHPYLITFFDYRFYNGVSWETSQAIRIHSLLDSPLTNPDDQRRAAPYQDGGEDVIFTDYELDVSGTFNDLNWVSAKDLDVQMVFDSYVSRWRMVVCGPNTPPIFIAKDAGGTHPWRVFASTSMWGDLGIENGADDLNFPRHVAVFESRLVFAETYNDPRRVRLSASNMITEFSIPDPVDYVASSPLMFDIDIPDGGQINWVVAYDVLVVGTSTAEVIIRSSDGAALSYANAFSRSYTRFGSASLPKAIMVNDSVMFIQGSGDTIREYQYSNERQSYTSPEITQLAREVFTSPVISWDVQYRPFMIVWMVLEDGDLIGATINKNAGVIAFHRHTTNGRFVDVVVSRNCMDPGHDDMVFFHVIRDLIPKNDTHYPGNHVQIYLEHFHVQRPGDLPEWMIYTHCSWVYRVVGGGAPSKVLEWDNSNGSYTRIKIDRQISPSGMGVFFFDHDYTDISTTNTWMVFDSTDPVDGYPWYNMGHLWEPKSPTPGSKLGYVVETYNPENERSGQTLSLLDGATIPVYVDQDRQGFPGDAEGLYVDNGTLTLQPYWGIAVSGVCHWAGWEQESVVKTLPVEPFDQAGPNVSRVVNASVRVKKTTHIKIGTDESQRTIDLAPAGWNFNMKTPPVSKEHFERIEGNYDEENFVVIKSVEGKPFSLVRVIAAAEGNRR